jgi:hypothetical protein
MTHSTPPKPRRLRKNAPAPTAATTDSILRVGEGRGFVVEDADNDRLVITAAHCLPLFPPCASASSLEERTYQALLGPIGQKAIVWAECFFVDPIGDIAVLGPPDSQELSEQWEAYDALMKKLIPLPIGGAPRDGQGWLLSLDGHWFRCDVQQHGGPLWISNAAEGIVGGMSGSPILTYDGTAIGVLCTSGGTGEVHTEGGPNPRLMYHLPTRFLPRRYRAKPAPNSTHKRAL